MVIILDSDPDLSCCVLLPNDYLKQKIQDTATSVSFVSLLPSSNSTLQVLASDDGPA